VIPACFWPLIGIVWCGKRIVGGFIGGLFGGLNYGRHLFGQRHAIGSGTTGRISRVKSWKY
jgi:hypothetical protein